MTVFKRFLILVLAILMTACSITKINETPVGTTTTPTIETPDVPTDEADPTPEPKVYSNMAYYYKLFYGEWKVEEVLFEHPRIGPDEGYLDIIGKTVYYDKTLYKEDGNMISDEPFYDIAIIPRTNKPFESDFWGEFDMGLGDKYFVFVSINFDWVFDEREFPFASEFYIKDDNTLILSSHNCLYRMSRVSYIDGYWEGMLEHI